jgi:hypothetical protein
MCAICLGREPVTALEPCGHRSLCDECATAPPSY